MAKVKFITTNIFLLFLFTVQVCAQMPDLTGVEILTHRVSGNIYMLEATGDVAGNIGVSVGDDGILIIDDQFAQLTEQISSALGKLTKGKLKFIINTHHHDDHSDGNALLKATHGAHIIAHDEARKYLLEKDKGHWPVITFNSELSLHFNGEKIHAVSLPGGHTDNDLVIFFSNSKVVHMGDLLNSGISSFPTADIEAGGSAQRILRNIEKIIPLIPDDVKIIPGHGPLTDKKELYRLRDMLRDTISLVLSKKEKGKSLQTIIDEGLQEKYKGWGYGYTPAEEWIKMIYNSPED